MTHPLQWKKYPVLNDGFICLVDHMGDDAAIVQAARVSYGKDKRLSDSHRCPKCGAPGQWRRGQEFEHMKRCAPCQEIWIPESTEELNEIVRSDRQLIRYLLNHSHTTPFEMCEIKFLVRVPMDCWRQWIRHRTANVNEYSTRYTEAIDSQQTTSSGEWRLQATDNKQGSSGFLEKWTEASDDITHIANMGYPAKVGQTPGQFLTNDEESFHQIAKELYQNRLALGVAKEQARKDLPLSTYTEAYWKCDLHNIFNFLRLRMDSHAQYEIRMYANAMAEIVKQLFPVAWEAFEDYVLYAKRFSRMEMSILRQLVQQWDTYGDLLNKEGFLLRNKPDSMTSREWKEFLRKVS